MRAFRFLATLLFILCIPTGLITSNIRFMANEPRIYRYAFDQFDAVQTTGIEREELLRAGAEIRQYFNNDQDELLIRVEQNGREVPLFNPRETAHMKDVKDRFRMMNMAQEFSILYGIAYVAAVVLWSREVSVRGLALRVMAGCGLGIATVAAAGALSLSGFDSAWADFHRLLFNNDFWRLNPATDHLIQMFPPDFWESLVFFIGLLSVAEAALLLVGAGIYLGVTKTQAASRPVRTYPAYRPG